MRFSKKKGLLIIFIVVAGLSVVVIGFFIKSGVEIGIPVFTSPVQRGDLKICVEARGEILPSQEYKIASLLSGVVDEVFVQEGDEVKKGELLLTIDKTELLSKLKEVEKNIIAYNNQLKELHNSLDIKRAQKLLAQAKLAFEDAKREYESLSRLYKKNAISLEELKKSESKFLKSKEDLKLHQEELAFFQEKRERELNLVAAQLKEAEANYSWIKKQLSWTEIKAPTAGIVIEKNPNVLPDHAVSSGMHLFTISGFSYKIKTLIDEVDIGKIHVGQKATVTVDAYPYQPITTSIKSISPQPILEKEGLRRFEVYLEDIRIDHLRITPRMQCSVEIVHVIPNILKVALADVVEEESKRYVFVIEEGRAKKKLIKTGLETEEEAEVLSGLEEGERIIKSPSMVKDGVKVIDISSENIKGL